MTDWLLWEGEYPGLGGALTADIVTAINAGAESDLTEHPVESGATISDHVLFRPRHVTVEFAQSEQPLENVDEVRWTQQPITPRESRFSPGGLLAVTMAIEGAVTSLFSAFGPPSLNIWLLTATNTEDRIHKLHDTILDVWRNAYLCTFTYKGLVLPDYIVTGVHYSRTAGEGGLARFIIDLGALTTVETGVSALAGGLSGMTPGAMPLGAIPILDLGSQGADKVEHDVVEKSLLASGLDLAGIGL